MGAGSSTEQRSPEQPEAGSGTPAEPEPEPEPSGGSPVAEAVPGAPGNPAIAAADPATKLLQKNGQLSTVNGLAEQGLAEQGELGLQEGAPNGQEEEVLVAEVGQRESEDVTERDSDKEMAANSAAVQDITKDGQEETPEITEQIPSSESNSEELTQPTEAQSNDVGFKKVFKFVGFKFTVKKDKSEKSDTVQLLTVKKEEGEGAGGSEGAGDHQEPSRESGEATTPKESEPNQPAEKAEETRKDEQSNTAAPLQAESGQAAGEGGDGEEKQEKEPTKSPGSPTSPVASETASPFKKFFTQGWAGWRKKTSFRKPKEEELEASEKKKEQEVERADPEEKEKTEDTSEKLAASAQPQPQPQPREAPESETDARLSAEYEKVELPSEGQVPGAPEEKAAPLATEVFDEKVEIVAEVHVSTAEEEAEGQRAEAEETEAALPPEKRVETNADQEAEPPEEEPAKTKAVCAPRGDHPQPPEPSPDEKAPAALPEGVVGEAEMLAAQERVKVQGSPLKKLFTSTGLKKLSAKKQKVKRGGGDEESGEQHPAGADSPDSTEEQKGESSASSPDEPEEITCLEKGVTEAPQEAELEEGTTSDGEKKREGGVTPWASFKKMVTPKKRVRRLSESDKEDELDKAKSATLSSTESAASEMQEDLKGHGEEPKPEEPKRKVDTSVSWEALICVGSSKKRARKASSSDDEGGPLKPTAGESQKPDDAGKDKEAGPDATPASSQEHEQGQGGSSPEQAGSPTDGEGVSTWESFKRLVTARKKSKSKLEEKHEDSVTGAGAEHAASDVEPGKEESWVSIKKLIPGRRKKRLDGKQDQATVEDTGPTEVNEDDSDVPAVVPLSEYDAVEREKMEAQEAQKNDEKPEQKVGVYVSEELSKSLVQTVTVAVIDGARAVADIEERSPSWISASVTEPVEQAEDEAKPPTEEVFESEVTAAETPVTKTLPESQDAGDDTIVSEMEFTSEAVTAAETTEAFCAEEATEASGAEETTDMVSAVSQLSDSPDTTEEATPVQEVEGGVPDMEDQDRRTQEVLQAVAEKVREEAQLLGARGPEDTSQTVQKVESQTPEKVGEAEEGSQGPDPKKEMEVVLKRHVEESETLDLTQGKGFVQAMPEHLEKVQVTERVKSSELMTTHQAGTLGGVKSEIILEQAAAPDSAETLTDSETNGSTPLADLEALHITQQDKITEVHASVDEVASGTQSQIAEAVVVPAPKEMLPAPAGSQPQAENKDHSKMGEVQERTDREAPVETVPVLSKMEGIQEAGQFADEETKDVPFVEGLEVSADAEITASQKKIIEFALKDEVPEEAEFQKNDNIELQNHTQSLRTPVEREMVVQVEREKMEAKPAQASEEKPEPKPAEVLSEQLVQTVHVTIIDGEKEVTGFEGSSPSWLVQGEAVCTEIQVQSSEASLPLTAAAVEEKVLGETVKILETAGTLESADAHLEPEEKSSEKEAFVVQPGQAAVPTGTESRAGSTPITVSTTPDKGISADLEGDKTTSQEGRSDEDDEQVSCQEVRVSETREEDLKAENEILQLKTESGKLVQNIIQTAVDQLVSTEEIATDCQMPAQVMTADNREAEQKIEKEERELQVSAEDARQTTTAKEESAPTPVEQTRSDISKDTRAASEEVTPVEVEGSSANDQQLEEVTLPAQEKREVTAAKPVLEDGDRDSQQDEKGEAGDYPGKQTSALEDAEASGGSTKESLDANGPKLKEKEVELQEGKEQSESEKETKTQTQETQKQERQPATPELTDS